MTPGKRRRLLHHKPIDMPRGQTTSSRSIPSFPTWAKVDFGYLLRLFPVLDNVLRVQGHVVTREVIVGETRYPLEIALVDLTKQTNHLQCVCRVPNVVQNSLEVRHVVGERQLADGCIAGLEAEGMGYAVSCEITILAVSQVHVSIRHIAVRDEIVDTRRWHRVEVTA